MLPSAAGIAEQQAEQDRKRASKGGICRKKRLWELRRRGPDIAWPRRVSFW